MEIINSYRKESIQYRIQKEQKIKSSKNNKFCLKNYFKQKLLSSKFINLIFKHNPSNLILNEVNRCQASIMHIAKFINVTDAIISGIDAENELKVHLITLREQIKTGVIGYMRSELYEKVGVDLIDNTSIEKPKTIVIEVFKIATPTVL